ncbi:hypothetical protein L596_029118 [Steinernema carpocapsae]|uniref:Major facilitator superfamily (MFS) profile domain-containing protein n=2 Tax=Steinernema carpocapsae TaxID=34508 RepID=A0A4U5LTP7_STECR|nr:hypothetical protein L596_029118 [Steinernema carpocapsae]
MAVNRYVVLLISLFCMCLIFANTLLFSFTVICMDPIDNNVNNTDHKPLLTKTEEGLLFSGVAFAAIPSMFVTVALINRIGLRLTFFFFGLLSGIATLLMPLSTVNMYLALIVRIVQGSALTSMCAAQGTVPAKLGRPTQLGFLVALFACIYELAPIMTMTLSSYLCTSPFGWQGVYYTFGPVTIFAFFVFLILYPTDRNRVTVMPETTSTVEIVETVESPEKSISYGKILKTPLVWGLWLSGVGLAAEVQVIDMFGPTFTNKVLHFDVSTTGLLSGISFALSICVKLSGGIVLDRITCVSARAKTVSFTLITQAGTALCFLILSFLTQYPDYAVFAQALFMLTILLFGLHTVGLFSGYQQAGGQSSDFLLSVFAVINSTTSLILPQILTLITPNNTGKEWSALFFGIGIYVVVTGAACVLLSMVRTGNKRNTVMDIQKVTELSVDA